MTIIETSHVKKYVGPATVINGVPCVTGNYIVTAADGSQTVANFQQLMALKKERPIKPKPADVPVQP